MKPYNRIFSQKGSPTEGSDSFSYRPLSQKRDIASKIGHLWSTSGKNACILRVPIFRTSNVSRHIGLTHDATINKWVFLQSARFSDGNFFHLPSESKRKIYRFYARKLGKCSNWSWNWLFRIFQKITWTRQAKIPLVVTMIKLTGGGTNKIVNFTDPSLQSLWQWCN